MSNSEYANDRQTTDEKLMASMRYIASLDRLISSRLASKDEGSKSLGYYYSLRNNAIIKAVVEARECGYNAGYVVHRPICDLVPLPMVTYNNEMQREITMAEPTWEVQYGVVAIIELPTGQVSWHLDSGDLKWDGHTNEEKSARIYQYVNKE